MYKDPVQSEYICSTPYIGQESVKAVQISVMKLSNFGAQKVPEPVHRYVQTFDSCVPPLSGTYR